MRKIKKIISNILLAAMCVSVSIGAMPTYAALLPTPKPDTVDEDFKCFELKDGYAMIEAEECDYDPNHIENIRSRNSSGRQAVRTLYANTTLPSKNETASLGFEFIADRDATYYMWYRCCSMDSSSYAGFLSFEGGRNNGVTYNGEYTVIAFGTDSKNEDDYNWRKVTANSNKWGPLELKKGEKVTVRLRSRHVNSRIDKFIITDNPLFTPVGMSDIPEQFSDEYVMPLPDKYPKPEITPPPEHPRVLVRKSDFETIKKNMEDPQNQPAVKEFNELKETEFDGILQSNGSKTNNDPKKLAIIEAKAFDYVFYGNEKHGREAIDAMLNYARTVEKGDVYDYSREVTGPVIFTMGIVYDWCHPLLTEKEKRQFVSRVEVLSNEMEVGFPPDKQDTTNGHGAEYQFQREWLTFAIATYDEFPDIYNFVGGRYFSDFVPSRNFWNVSGTHHQGTNYGVFRYGCDMWGQWLIYRMSGVKPLEDTTGQIPYWFLYNRRADGQLFRVGDAGEGVTDWGAQTSFFLSSNFYKDPYIRRENLKDQDVDRFIYSDMHLTPVIKILLQDPTIPIEEGDYRTLPLAKYFPFPGGEIVAHTSWDWGMDSEDVAVRMNIGGMNPIGHHHYDAGAFQIYYKGALFTNGGWYRTTSATMYAPYYKTSISKNTLAIGKDSQDKVGKQMQTDWGVSTYKNWFDVTFPEGAKIQTSEIAGYEIGPDTQYPRYSYISGDIAGAYNQNVKEASRSMLFLPLEEQDSPAAFVVFDKVETDTNDVKKAFLVHMQEEPTVDEKNNIITATKSQFGYNGKITDQVLLPKEVRYDIIGGKGKEFMVDGVNYPSDTAVDASSGNEAGWGRIEIMPEKTDYVDYFLNVMYVGEADEQKPLEKADLIETDEFVGTKIFNRVAMFNRNKVRTKKNVNFLVTGTDAELEYNVAGLKEGTWSVRVNGKDYGNHIASKDGGIIYFIAPAGACELVYASEDANKTFTQGEPPTITSPVVVKLNRVYLYSDVPAQIINGRTLIPMRALLEQLGAKVTYDEATGTATAKEKKTTVKITQNQRTAYVNGQPYQLDVPAQIIDGRFMIPVRFVSEALGATVTWNELAQQVNISKTIAKKSSLGIPNMIEIVDAVQSGDDGTNDISRVYDGLMGTNWAVSGEKGAAWGVFDLGEEFNLDSVQIAFQQGNKRVYVFDIEVSLDGVNFKPAATGLASSGETLEFESYPLKGAKARYVRYVGQGNSSNLWNNLFEIVFIEKK